MPRRSDPDPNLEVELKYPVSDLSGLAQRLQDLGAQEVGPDWENDLYFAAPDRDFTSTDEALRLRRTNQRLWLTYKGPRLDPASKTRKEIEVELKSPALFDQACVLLEHLGYRLVAALFKERTRYQMSWREYSVQVCLDKVSRLGSFVELETKAPVSQLNAARQALEELGQKLGLQHRERRSYLELYLERLAHLPPDDLLASE